MRPTRRSGGAHGERFKFYSELFGWKILEEMDMGPTGTYRVFGGDKRLGGIMTTP